MYADDCLIYLSITVKDASLAVHCIMLGRQHLSSAERFQNSADVARLTLSFLLLDILVLDCMCYVYYASTICPAHP